MRKLICLFIVFVALVLSGCGFTVIKPGEVGIKVNNLGTDRGVDKLTIKTGLVFYMPWMSSVFDYPISVQTAKWTESKHEGSALNEEITFNTKEGTQVRADISLSYQLEQDKVPAFYVKFRSDDLDNFTHGFLRNIARDAFNELGAVYTLEEVYGIKKEELLIAVKKRINTEVAQYGVQMIQLGFLGRLKMEKSIEASINNKLTAIQNAIAAENQLRQVEAQAKMNVAKAEGEAKANLALAQSITPNLVLWRQLEISEKAIARWNGTPPSVMGDTGGKMLFNIPIK
jgi:regulator of protease activity HflC (stomatin/prohibitin superfamily)